MGKDEPWWEGMKGLEVTDRNEMINHPPQPLPLKERELFTFTSSSLLTDP
jgi:hypothetical protein